MRTSTALAFAIQIAAVAGGNNECGLYLAPSSTSDESEVRLGMYAGKTYGAGSVVGQPELALQLLDTKAHNGIDSQDPEEADDDGLGWFATMLWTPDSTGAIFETLNLQTITVIPGVGMLGNFHPGLVNAEWDQMATIKRSVFPEHSGDVGKAHPGRGAFTSFYNVTVRSLREIPAGMEIFPDFGSEWAADNTDESVDATRDDYEKADKVVDAIAGFMEKYEKELSKDPDAKNDLYKFLVNDVVALATPTVDKGKIAQSLLPPDHAKLSYVKEVGGTLIYKNPQILRDMDWLKEHGQCMDNIVVKPSTVPHAGLGAFAARSIPEGGLVVPAPLIHITDRSRLLMYDLEDRAIYPDDPSDKRVYKVRTSTKDPKPVSSQLLLNYCFGHPDSSMLLYPVSATSNYINHKSSNTGSGPNAKIVWTKAKKESALHNPDWLKRSPQELEEDESTLKIGLAFDVVATKKIAKGDEIFIDYGDDWDRAWKEHVDEWKKSLKNGKNKSASSPTALEYTATFEKEGIKPFRTPEELKENPYPENLMTICFLSYEPLNEKHPVVVDGMKVHRWVEEAKAGEVGTFQGDHMMECQVEEYMEATESFNYTVTALSDDHKKILIRSVPHIAIRFVDKPYTSEQHNNHAFRHYIGVPDDIYPQEWKNLKSGGNKAQDEDEEDEEGEDGEKDEEDEGDEEEEEDEGDEEEEEDGDEEEEEGEEEDEDTEAGGDEDENEDDEVTAQE